MRADGPGASGDGQKKPSRAGLEVPAGWGGLWVRSRVTPRLLWPPIRRLCSYGAEDTSTVDKNITRDTPSKRLARSIFKDEGLEACAFVRSAWHP